MTKAQLGRIEADLGQYQARHAKKAGLPNYKKLYAHDPVLFGREVLGFEPYPKQQQILEALLHESRIECHGCNSSGKDATAAVAALWWTFTKDNSLTIITSATQRQVVEVNFGREIGPRWRGSGLPGELYQQALRVDGQTRILGLTSSDASKLTGFHGPEILIIISEAQGVESWAYEAAFACATGPDDVILAVGNPLSPVGLFFEASRSDAWHSIEISAFDHPNLKEGRTVIPGGPSEKFVETMRSMYGTGSGIFEARVLGRFPDESVYGLCRRDWLVMADARYKAGDLVDPRAEVVIGIDVARFGPDSTVMAVRRGPVLLELIRWHGADTMQTVERIKDEAARFGATPLLNFGSKGTLPAKGRLIVDEIGLGAGVLDKLKQDGYRADGFNAATRARKHKDYLNKRAEWYFNLRKLLEEGQIAIAHHEDLWQELVSTEWSVDGQGRVKIEPKQDLAARLGRSPDLADACAMAFGGAPSREPVVIGMSELWRG